MRHMVSVALLAACAPSIVLAFTSTSDYEFTYDSSSFDSSTYDTSYDTSYSYDYSDCVELEGIVSGGGSGVLDLETVTALLGNTTSYDPAVNPTGVAAQCSPGIETPIALRHVLARDAAVYSVAQMFHPTQTALDIFGDAATSDSRRRCQPSEGDSDDIHLLHMRVATLYADVYALIQYIPDCIDTLIEAMDELGLSLDLVLTDQAHPEYPWGLAKAYVDESFAFMEEYDGWNSDGTLSREYNLIPFSDYNYTDAEGDTWAPYVPKNSPWVFDEKDYWQPLMEDDGLGFITTQEHVTPHIGATGRLFGFSSQDDEDAFITRQLDDPNYDYYAAAVEVLEENKLTGESSFRLAMVAFFDDKTLSLTPLATTYFLRDPSLPELDYYRVTCANSLAVYNGVVMSWREKVRHDKPRPPTIVADELGDQYFETYAGDAGVQFIKASEWEPVIRTMPHSEFPSASACLCQVYAEQMQHYTGSDVLDPPLDSVVSPELVYQFPSWTNMSDTCAWSRLWGGMHFSDAVPAGADLCGGGQMAASISSSLDLLLEGDESAAIFDTSVGDINVRPY